MISPNPKETPQGQGLLLILFLQIRTQTFAFDGKVVFFFFFICGGVTCLEYPHPWCKFSYLSRPKIKNKTETLLCNLFDFCPEDHLPVFGCLLGLLIYPKVWFLPLRGKVEGSL